MKATWRSVDRIAIIYGVLDGAVGLSFAVHLPVQIWYLIGVTLKVIILFGRTRSARLSPLDIATVISLVFIGLISAMSSDGSDAMQYLAFVAFLTSLSTSLALINPANLKEYLGTICYSITFTALLHIFMAKTGHVVNNNGRFNFFDGQPNLGGENAAIGSVAGLYGLKRPRFLLCAAALLFDALLLEARSALLTILPSILLGLIFSENLRVRKNVVGWAPIVAALASPFIYLFLSSSMVSNVFTDVFQLNSRSRGLGTGASGRSDIWRQAIEFFLQSPLIGHPLGYFETMNYIGAHNFVLYGLAQFGLPFLAILVIFSIGYFLAARNGLFQVGVLLCVTPLLMFNDRLVNLNAYPFVFYVLVLKLALTDKISWRPSKADYDFRAKDPPLPRNKVKSAVGPKRPEWATR